MKQINKLSVRVVLAIAIGFLLAGAVTKITYNCPPIDGAIGCVTFDKAIMHPSDLLNNKQNSLTRFIEAFAITSFVGFSILSIFSLTQRKPKPVTQPKD